MNKSIFVIIVYIVGIIFSALVLKIWSAETNIVKAGVALIWTALFLIALFYTDKYDKK